MQNTVENQELDFIIHGEGDAVVSNWSPKSSGVYPLDTKIGRTYAKQTVEVMRRTDNPSLLGRIVHGMVDAGKFEGVEIGFTHYIAERTIYA